MSEEKQSEKKSTDRLWIGTQFVMQASSTNSVLPSVLSSGFPERLTLSLIDRRQGSPSYTSPLQRRSCAILEGLQALQACLACL